MEGWEGLEGVDPVDCKSKYLVSARVLYWSLPTILLDEDENSSTHFFVNFYIYCHHHYNQKAVGVQVKAGQLRDEWTVTGATNI